MTVRKRVEMGVCRLNSIHLHKRKYLGDGSRHSMTKMDEKKLRCILNQEMS